MLLGFAAHMLRRRKEAAVHHWMSSFDWASMSAAMLLWVVLIALVGYVAALAAWRSHT
jgi:pilus assembly protein TadC